MRSGESRSELRSTGPRAGNGTSESRSGAARGHRWLDSWTGVGLIAVGLHRQGWDLQLTQYGDGNWRATFYVTGQAHSIVGGSAWEPTPWRAVQRAALGGGATMPGQLPKSGGWTYVGR